MARAEWVSAAKCPKCGGQMTLSEHFALTHDYRIRRDGTLYKRHKKSPEGPIDCVTAYCEGCKTYWDGDHTINDIDGVYVRGEGTELPDL